jgi:hypothetical protein
MTIKVTHTYRDPATGVDHPCESVLVNGGWTLIKVMGTKRRVRNGSLTPVVANIEQTPDEEVTPKGPRIWKIGKSVANISNYIAAPGFTTSSGRQTLDCGDKIASLLRGMELGYVYKVAAFNLGESVEALTARYSHLNPGMQRMTLGNRIRKLSEVKFPKKGGV